MINLFLIPNSGRPNERLLLWEWLDKLGWEFIINSYQDKYHEVVCNQTKEVIQQTMGNIELVKFVTKQGILTLKEFNNLPKYLWRPFKGNNAWFINEFPLFNTLITKCLYGREYKYHYNNHYFNTLEEAQEYCKICIKKECIELLNCKQIPEVKTDLISYVIVCDLLYSDIYFHINREKAIKKRSMMLSDNPQKVIKSHCNKFLKYVK